MTAPEQDRIWNLFSRKLTGEASAPELAEYEALLEKNPAVASVCREMEQLWNQGNHNIDTEFLEATYLLHQMRLEEKGYPVEQSESKVSGAPEKPRSRKKIFLSLAVLTTLALVVLLFIPGKEKAAPETRLAAQTKLPPIEVSTRNGSHSKIQLPDGSQVWLNAGSKLNYDKSFGNNNREVYLNGEAFFDVVKNPEKPFIIHTTSMKLRVLGTQFNVRCYANENTSEASLVHGSLEVTEKKKGRKWVLKPNEKIVVFNQPLVAAAHKVAGNNNTVDDVPVPMLKPLTYHSGDTISIEAAWTKNRLSFKNETFESVARKLERWYDAEFIFADEQKKGLMMYGSFTNETLDQALAALEFSFNFRYRIEEKKVFIY